MNPPQQGPQMDRDLEFLILRATPLIFAVFGQMRTTPAQRIVRVGGSGIFIAPFLSLTARHVARDFFRIDSSRTDELNRRTSGYFELPHSSNLIQPLRVKERPAFWSVRRTWDPVFTDICLMEVFAHKDEACGMEHQMTGFFDWALLPPPVGTRVVMLGYPRTDIEAQDNKMNVSLNYAISQGVVTKVCKSRRERGMYNFPGFLINQPVDPAFSGGPIFWKDLFCGIVSGGTVDDCTYAASLWPLCLLEYEYPDLGTIGAKTALGELFERRVLRSQDWPSIKNRIAKGYDADGKPYARISSQAR